MTYKHTQIGWVALTVCLVVLSVFELLPTSRHVREITRPVLYFILLLMAVLMSTLTVEVDETHVRVKFGIGLIRKSFRLDEITSGRPVRNRWWWGWGIRLVPGGWLYNVSGLDAVELVLRNGKVFRIGTDEPQVLADFIQARIARES